MNLLSFSEFAALVRDVWNTGVRGSSIGELLTALAIFAVFLLIRRLFSTLIMRRLKRWTRHTKSDVDDRLFDALDGPLRFVPAVFGFFVATTYLQLEGTPADIVSYVNRSLVAFTIFWGVYRSVSPLLALVNETNKHVNDTLTDWLTKVLKIGVALLGGATILEVWGVEVAPILAGLGLFGVAVALGAQDLFKNLIAGLFVIGEQRFKIGDWIKVDDLVEGTVETIGFRTTKVRRFDKAPVFVPNARLSDGAVTNFSGMTHRRIYWMIGVEYRTNVAQLREIRDGIETFLHNDEAFADPSEVSTFVRIDKFNDSSIDIMVYCFTRTTVWGEWLEVKERLAYEIKRIVEAAGSGFAFPSQSVYVEQFPGNPEVFPLSVQLTQPAPQTADAAKP